MPSPRRRREVADFGSVYVNRAAIKDASETIKQMADDILLINTRCGSVESDDLQLLGWTQQQINRHGRDARDRASMREVRAA